MGKQESESETEQAKDRDASCSDKSDEAGLGLSGNQSLPYIEYTFHDKKDWLEWRLSHIGASESAAILGVCPFTTKLQLMKRKLGMEKFKPNRATEHGKSLEPVVLEMLSIKFGEKLQEKVLQSRKHTHLVAQIDGLSDNYQFEIKCPYAESSFLKMVSGIPYHYVVQMQHQLLVTGRSKALFAFYYKGHLLTHSLQACPALQSQILDASQQFVASLQKTRESSER